MHGKLILLLIIFNPKVFSLNHIKFNSSKQFSTFDSNCLSKVIKNLIEIFYAQNNFNFDFIIYEKSSWKLNKIFNELGNSTKLELHKIKEIKNPVDWNHELSQSAVIFIKTFKSAQNFMRKVSLANFHPKKFKFLIYIEELKSVERLKEFPKVRHDYKTPGHLINFAYFLINLKSEIQLSTIERFTEKACDEFQIVTQNIYNKKSKRWKNNIKINEKLRNFHDCKIFEFTNLKENNQNLNFYFTKNKVTGIIGDFSQALAEYGNYTVEFQTFNNKTPHVMHHFWSPRENGILHVSSVYHEQKFGFWVTPGEKYSSYEKLLLPFDDETWIYLLITFGVAFFIIFLINRTPRFVQNLVYGIGVKTPTYNVLAIFFGIGQIRVPNENSARIVLTFFIFFCLIIRTAYQGVLFEMITSDMRKKIPRTIKDLHDMNYSIAVLESSIQHLQNQLMIFDSEHMPKILSFNVYPSDLFSNFYVSQIFNDSAKLAFFLSGEMERILQSQYQVTGILMYEDFLTYQIGIGTTRNNFLLQLTEEVSSRLINGGILQWSHSLHTDQWFKKYPLDKDSEPTVLCVDDLKFGFIIWLIACGISSLMFLCEILNVLVSESQFYIQDLIGILMFIKYFHKIGLF